MLTWPVAMNGFLGGVCLEFDLGEPNEASQIQGSTNRLWRVDASRGTFVIKEFPHEGSDIAGRVEAARFEDSVAASGQVLMPEPVAAASGELIAVLEGSRGRPVPVRVHRWSEGQPVTDVEPSLAARAGRSLARIQTIGRGWSTRESGSLEWWDVSPSVVLERLERAGLLSGRESTEAAALLREAYDLVAEGERVAGTWVFTHCDHKPENCLLLDGSVAVLDWDECGHCHPKLEAVEAAARWSGVYRGIDQETFALFMQGYVRDGGRWDPLVPGAFAKLVAASAGWFGFMGRRALGDFDDNADERASAVSMARDALDGLRRILDSIPGWCRLS